MSLLGCCGSEKENFGEEGCADIFRGYPLPGTLNDEREKEASVH